MILNSSKRNIARAKTPDGYHRVFAYGSLKTGHDFPLVVRGLLTLRPTGQAAVDFTDRDAWTVGELVEVDDRGLRALDVREGAGCSPPFYTRILVKTRSGIVCWAYQWARSFSGHSVVQDGIWRWRHLRVHRDRYGSRNVIKPRPMSRFETQPIVTHFRTPDEREQLTLGWIEE